MDVGPFAFPLPVVPASCARAVGKEHILTSESTPDRPWPLVLDEVTSALEALNEVLGTEPEFPPLLHHVCQQVTAAVPGVDDATLTLLREGKPSTAATTSETAARLDRDQYATGDGPCIQAARTGNLVRMSVSGAPEKWLVFARDCEAAGFSSVVSAPFATAGGQAGAVNCYSTRDDGFADLDEKLLALFTSSATAALCSHTRNTRARDAAEHLNAALSSRAVTDQAKGILMAVRHITADEAFTLLVEQSQRENVKLRDLATWLVDHASKPATGP